MATKRSAPAKPEVTFTRAADALEAFLDGPARKAVLDELSRPKPLAQALQELRKGMRANVFSDGKTPISLARIVRKLDERTRLEGFHVLHDWDGQADKLNEDTIPVDVVSYAIELSGSEPNDDVVLAILLDYHFSYVLALLSMRVWDEGNVDDNLERVTRLLEHLQGPHGSGQRFADDAETLILLATSHFEADEGAYERLLEKVRRFRSDHQAHIALAHAAILSSHLRFGFEATYGRDVAAMRKDNEADYPWLSFALSTLLTMYARMEEGSDEQTGRDRVVEALLNGLAADPRAFVGELPSVLAGHEEERSRFLDLFHRHRDRLLDDFARHRPAPEAYSPLSFYFNFLHNLVKGTVVDAVRRRKPWGVTVNDLLTGVGSNSLEERESLAKVLMGYARAHPDRIRGRWTPVIVYDPRSGSRTYSETLRRLRS